MSDVSPWPGSPAFRSQARAFGKALADITRPEATRRAEKLLQHLEQLRPKNATGVYITSFGISFGFRTNRAKFPENFMELWPR